MKEEILVFCIIIFIFLLNIAAVVGINFLIGGKKYIERVPAVNIVFKIKKMED